MAPSVPSPPVAPVAHCGPVAPVAPSAPSEGGSTISHASPPELTLAYLREFFGCRLRHKLICGLFLYKCVGGVFRRIPINLNILLVGTGLPGLIVGEFKSRVYRVTLDNLVVLSIPYRDLGRAQCVVSNYEGVGSVRSTSASAAS